MDVVSVFVFDDTCDATLWLCGHVTASAAAWKTYETILLISNPGLRGGKRPTLCINFETQVDVDPCMHDANWLRSFARRSTMKDVVNVPFPEGGMSKMAT